MKLEPDNAKNNGNPGEAAPDADGEDLDIRPTDILFECPQCGKSMVIDYRGAGLAIPCVDCEQPVEVPIPEGMDVNDLDSSVAEQGVRVIQMRGLLSDAQQKILDQENAIEKLRHELEAARQRSEETGQNLREIQWELEAIQRSVEKISQVMQRSKR